MRCHPGLAPARACILRLDARQEALRGHFDLNGCEQVLWPDHCVPGTFGADFHKDLHVHPVDLIIRKGNDPLIDSYSTFVENNRET